MIDVVVGDTNALFADVVGDVLSARGYSVHPAATTLDRLCGTLERAVPAVCLLDHVALGPGALEAVRRAVGRSDARTKVLVVSGVEHHDAASAALAAGASGWVSKTSGTDDLLVAIDRVVSGERVVERSPRHRPRVSDEVARAHRMASHLTRREWESLAMLVDGAGTPHMVREMGVSTMTVRSHIQAVLTKLGVHSRLEAASYAVRNGLLADEVRGSRFGLERATG